MDAPRSRALAAYWKAFTIVDPLRLDAWGERGITLPLLRVLAFVREHPGASAGAIADYLGISPSATTNLVDRLVEPGLLRREAQQTDRRVSLNFVEDAGAQVLSDAVDRGSAFMTDILHELTPPELERLTTSLERLTAAAARVGEHRRRV